MDNVDIAEAYYTAWGEKDVARMERFLHLDAQLITPLEGTVVLGKDAILEKLKKGAAILQALKIRAKFGAADQTMLVIDVDFPAPAGNLRTASLMTFHKGLITRIELFFDARQGK